MGFHFSACVSALVFGLGRAGIPVSFSNFASIEASISRCKAVLYGGQFQYLESCSQAVVRRKLCQEVVISSATRW